MKEYRHKAKTIRLRFLNVKNELREFVFDRWRLGEILYEQTDDGYIISHPKLGRLGQLSIFDNAALFY
jgi:hypothetical protein